MLYIACKLMVHMWYGEVNNNSNNKIYYSVRNDSHCTGTTGDSGKE